MSSQCWRCHLRFKCQRRLSCSNRHPQKPPHSESDGAVSGRGGDDSPTHKFEGIDFSRRPSGEPIADPSHHRAPRSLAATSPPSVTSLFQDTADTDDDHADGGRKRKNLETTQPSMPPLPPPPPPPLQHAQQQRRASVAPNARSSIALQHGALLSLASGSCAGTLV